MIIADFLTQVKREGRVDGDTDFDAFAVDMLNELILEAVMQERIPELRILDFPLDLPPDDEPIALPSDYLKMYRVRYENFLTGKSWILNDGTGVVEPAPPGFYGFPKFFSIVGQEMYIRPWESILVDDVLSIDYYRNPDPLSPTELDSEIEPARMVPYLIRATLARVKVYHSKLQDAQFHTADAQKGARGFVDENKPKSEAEPE